MLHVYCMCMCMCMHMYHLSSHAPTCAAPQTAAVKNRENWLSLPPFAMKRPSLRDRAAGKLPFRGLGCHFVDQNVAHVSHTPCRRPQWPFAAQQKATQTPLASHWASVHRSTPTELRQALPCMAKLRVALQPALLGLVGLVDVAPDELLSHQPHHQRLTDFQRLS